MSFFVEKIRTESAGTFEFMLNRIYTVDGMRFLVSVMDKNSKSLLFSMERVDSRWVLVDRDNLPLWLWECEEGLSNSILKHIAEWSNL